MSPLPTQMVNRWERREEPKPGHGHLYWHILLGDQLQIQALASIAQKKLARIAGLHFTPHRWLHITTLPLGPFDEFTSDHVAKMASETERLLSGFSSIEITLNKVFYHPEAIGLRVEPDDALSSLRAAVQHATDNSIGSSEATQPQHWVPHVTLAYSTVVQPMSPIITALGHELPVHKAEINSVSLVVQEGPERLWNWRRLIEIPLRHLHHN